jgi:hypothetical protein
MRLIETVTTDGATVGDFATRTTPSHQRCQKRERMNCGGDARASGSEVSAVCPVSAAGLNGLYCGG